MELQFNESNGQVQVTIPATKVKKKGWRKRLEDGEDIEVDFSFDQHGRIVMDEV